MKHDRRVRYTKRALMESLISLMKEKPIERITVKEICDRADINRSTFYVHFANPGELLDSVKGEMYDEIKNMRHDYSDIRGLMLDVLNTFRSYSELLSVLVKSMDSIGFIYNVLAFWKGDFDKGFSQSGIPEVSKEIAYNFMLAGTASTIVIWALGGYARNAEDVAEDIYKMVTGCVKSFIGEV